MESSPQGYLIYNGILTDIPYYEAVIGYILFSMYVANMCFKILGMTAAFLEGGVYATYIFNCPVIHIWQ